MTRQELSEALDARVYQVLLPSALALGALYVLLGTMHWLLLPKPAKGPMATIAFASAFVLLVFAAVFRRSAWPALWAHPLAACLAGIVLGNSLAHIFFTHSPHTNNLVFVAIGVGCVFLSIRWLAVMLAAVLGGWVGGVWLLVHPGSPAAYFDSNLACAAVLAILIFTLRLRTYTHLEELRLRDTRRTGELEAALVSAEQEIRKRQRAEADLEKARAELERRVEERTLELAAANAALRGQIAERARIEADLRKSEANLLAAQSVGHIGSWDLDLRTGELHWSAETFRIFGSEPGAFTPTRAAFYAAVHPDDRAAVTNALDQALGAGATYNIDHRIVRPEGSERLVCEKAEVVFAPSGQAVQLIGTVQDITDRKGLEDQLRQAQKMEAVGQLAGGVAHDFNNILAAILMNLGLLREEPQLSPEILASLKEIEVEANRAANLIRQLLVFSRRQIPQRRPLDLNEVLGNLLKLLRRLLGEHVILEFPGHPDLPSVEADVGMIEQVVMNLSVNARDAMPSGGRLTIGLEVVELDGAAATANPEARPGRFVCLAVADTGCGMDEVTRKRVFEPFFTTKDVGQGTGLGLATVYGIAKQHQGWTEVASAIGQGTTFRVFLPVATAAAPAPLASPPPAAWRGGHETILLVEDEPAVRRLVGRCLRRSGYRVFEATNGVEALELWRQHGERIDLLFTDMVMPEGMTGLALAERLRADKSALKVIVSSGYSLEITSRGAPAGGKTAFLAKPYEMSSLAATVRRCLDEP